MAIPNQARGWEGPICPSRKYFGSINQFLRRRASGATTPSTAQRPRTPYDTNRTNKKYEAGNKKKADGTELEVQPCELFSAVPPHVESSMHAAQSF